MTIRFSALRSLLITGIFGAVLVAALAFAQQTQEQPSGQPAGPPQGAKPAPIMQPQPTTVPGRPDIPNAEVATKLRGIPAPPFPAPPDKLPIAQLKPPKGFK